MSSMGPLDLSTADTSGFEALPAGRYNAEIFEMTMDATKGGPTAKLPKGTPMMKIQVKLVDEGVNNRRAFGQFVIPPENYDPKKRSTMLGMIVNFYVALGFKEEEVKTAGFDPDWGDLIGVPVVVVLGREPKKDSEGNTIEDEYNNPIKGWKPAGSITQASTEGSLL